MIDKKRQNIYRQIVKFDFNSCVNCYRDFSGSVGATLSTLSTKEYFAVSHAICTLYWYVQKLTHLDACSIFIVFMQSRVMSKHKPLFLAVP